VDFGFARRAQKFDFQNPQNLSEKKKKKKEDKEPKRKTNFALNFPDNLAKRALTPRKLTATSF